jgi:kynurenine formamidase
MPQFIEVSHPVREGMVTYRGLPEPRMETLWTYDSSRGNYKGQAEFYIASLHLCGNTGTYVDAPIHRFRGGADLAAWPLEKLAHLETLVVGAAHRAIGPECLAGVPIRDRAVLFHTGWSRRWNTPAYFEPSPFLTRQACEALLDGGVAFAGIDSLNIDDVNDLARPAHTLLLKAGVPICEHMTNLAAVPRQGGRLHAVPIAWVGGASFPVRAYVLV